MLAQALTLADAIRRERELALSPARLERRRLVAMMEALRCCTTSLAVRLRSVLASRATTCCATA